MKTRPPIFFEENFIMPAHQSMLLIDDKPGDLLAQLDSYRPLEADKAQWARSINNT
jgi:hypothetical protein